MAEVTGHTASPGLDVDTLYGRLLRRMTPRDEETRYAVTRVSTNVRTLLDIDVRLVGEDGAVPVLTAD